MLSTILSSSLRAKETIRAKMNSTIRMGVDRDSGCENKGESNGDYGNKIRGNYHEYNVRIMRRNYKRKFSERVSDNERRSYDDRRREGEGGSRYELYFRKRGYKTNKQNDYSGDSRDCEVDYRRQERSSAGYKSYPSLSDRGQRYSEYPTHSRRSPLPSYRREGAREGEMGGDMGVRWEGTREAGRLDFPDKDRKTRRERETRRFKEKKGIKGWVTGQSVANRMREEDRVRGERKKVERRGREEKDGRKRRMEKKDGGRMREEWRRKHEKRLEEKREDNKWQMGRRSTGKIREEEQWMQKTGRESASYRGRYSMIKEERQQTKEGRYSRRFYQRPSQPHVRWAPFSSGPHDSRQSLSYRRKMTPSRLSQTTRKSLPSTWRQSSQNSAVNTPPLNNQNESRTKDIIASNSGLYDDILEEVSDEDEKKVEENVAVNENLNNLTTNNQNESRTTDNIVSNSGLYDALLDEMLEENEKKVDENVAGNENYTIEEIDYDQLDFEFEE